MKMLAVHEIGEAIRKVRRERGLRLEDLADDNISPATVSNIERGVAHVSPEKIKYLLEKLDLSLTKLPEMLMQEQEKLKKVRFRLATVATLRQVGQVEEAIERLEELNLDETHPLIAHAYYYKGKCYLEKRRWKQAERSFSTALRLAQQNPYKENNMEAASYLMLGVLHDEQNELDQALEYTNNGIHAYIEGGENLYIKSLLYRNKGVYLKRLGRITEGMRLTQDVWEQIPKIDDVATVLSFYWLRAEFSRLSGLLDEAIDYAMEGIELARRNEQYDSLCDLWTTLGNVYTHLEEWDTAETSFLMALKLESKFPEDQRMTNVYARVGILYMKQGRTDEAAKALQKAIRSAEKCNDTARLSTCLFILGDLHRAAQQIDEAISAYQKTIHICQKYDYKQKEAKLWFQLATCYEGSDEQQFQACMQNMYLAQKEFAKAGADFIEEVI